MKVGLAASLVHDEHCSTRYEQNKVNDSQYEGQMSGQLSLHLGLLYSLGGAAYNFGDPH